VTDITETIKIAIKHHQAGSLEKARQQYQLVLQSVPDNPVALHSLGLIYFQTGQYEQAVEMIEKAIEQNQQVPQFYNTLGLALESLKRYEDAIVAYQQAVLLKPDFAEVYNNMGTALLSHGQYAMAVETCKKALSLQPDYAQAYNTMGYAFQKQTQLDKAMDAYKQAIHLRPDFAEAYNHLGIVLNEQGCSERAIEYYTQAIRLDPQYAEAYNNLGVSCKAMEQFDEAIENYRHALRLDPDFEDAYCNLANILRDLGQCREAIDNYKRAIQLDLSSNKAYWNLTLATLLSGDFLEGWKNYRQHRNTLMDKITGLPDSGKPRWVGSSFSGKRLFIYYEQGLGDIIQLARYLPLVKSRGGTVILETLEPLLELLHSFDCIDDIIEYSTNDKSFVEFDLYTSLVDMPNIFGTMVDTVPDDVPYFYAEPQKAQYWHEQLAGDDFKVGIVWAGSPTHGFDQYRSCKLADFAPLANIRGVQLYGLQKGVAAAQMDEAPWAMQIVNISKHFQNLADTAAAIENLDLVISVDTSVLHLAGAMGKPTWALIPFAPEWRWMMDRNDSPWYPTMKLFRQETWGDWHGVFARVAQHLQAWVDNKPIQSVSQW